MIHRHLFLRCLLLLLLLIASAVQADDSRKSYEKKDQDASLVERAIGVTTAAFNSRWDTIRTRAKLTWLNVRPSTASRSESSKAEVAKEAAARSFEVSKETVEGAARTVADVAGEALEKTKEKVKRTVSTARGHSDDVEL